MYVLEVKISSCFILLHAEHGAFLLLSIYVTMYVLQQSAFVSAQKFAKDEELLRNIPFS